MSSCGPGGQWGDPPCPSLVLLVLHRGLSRLVDPMDLFILLLWAWIVNRYLKYFSPSSLLSPAKLRLCSELKQGDDTDLGLSRCRKADSYLKDQAKHQLHCCTLYILHGPIWSTSPLQEK